MHGTTGPASAATALAAPGDFALGDGVVSPSLRALRGPVGSVSVEPRVMQVLLALAAADGAVVTRGRLMAQCWPGQTVGDDTLNRAIFEIRRAARAAGVAGFTLATVPKSGYRLTGAAAPAVAAEPAPTVAAERAASGIETAPAAVGPGASAIVAPPPPAPSRRWLFAAAAGSAVGAAGLAVWRPWQFAADPRVADLLARGRMALRDQLPGAGEQGAGFLGEAVALDPDNAAAWGALALAWRNIAEFADPANTAAAVSRTEIAARRALALDPRQGDALAALATLPPIFGDWQAAEKRMRSVLAVAPDNMPAADALGVLMMATGRVRARMPIADRLVEREPLSPIFQMHRIYGLWSNGRDAEADSAAGRAFALWPSHPAIWSARVWTLAFTGRTAAARRLAEGAIAAQPTSSTMLTLIARSIAAIETRAPALVAAVVADHLAAAGRGEGWAVNAIQVLSTLGALDAAFAVTDGYLLGRGPIVVDPLHDPRQPSVNDQRRRKTMMLFVPSTAAMRADPRFITLVRDIGLLDFWRGAGIVPDFLGNRGLPA